MEVIKKKVERVMTTGTTTGDTSNSYVIIPDLDAKYVFNILLTTESYDFGFFDAIVENPYPYPYSSDTNDEIIGIGESLLLY